MNWFILAWKRTFDFKGRSRRREYGWFFLINILLSFVLEFFLSAGQTLGLWELANILGFVVLAYSLAYILASISLTTRRLHDLGWSGWWQVLIYLIPIILIFATLFALDKELGAIQQGEYVLYGVSILSVLAILIFSLMLVFKSGQPHTNEYGEDPKMVQYNNTKSLE